MHRYLILVLLVLVPLVALPQTGKQRSKTATKAQTPEKATATAPQKQMEKEGSGLHDILVKHLGMSTNLGRLSRVGPDYVLFDTEDGQFFLSFAALVSVREVPPAEDEEEPGEMTLEIKIVATD